MNNKINIFPLFSYPVCSGEIDPKCFNKQQIIDVILRNYNKSKERNKAGFNNSISLHHSYNDHTNENFETPPFSELEKIYGDVIEQLLKKMQFTCDFDYEIIGYNVIGTDQGMEPHSHAETDFFFVHYLKMNPEKNSGIVLHNPSILPHFIIRDDIIIQESEAQQYLRKTVKLIPQQDSFLMAPSWLLHSVPIQKQLPDEEEYIRIAVIVNVRLIG